MKGLVLFAFALPLLHGQAAGPRVFRLEELRTPPGYEVSVYAVAGNVPRHMVFGPNGVLYVATRGNGRILAIPEAGRTVTVATGLPGVHTLAFRGNDLWVAQNDGVVRLRDAVTADLVVRTQPERIVNVPEGGQHSTRTLQFDNEGRLYVSIGSTCNFCNEADRRRAAVVRFDADGRNETLFATGLRNTVGMALHPVTGQIWGTDHGGDNLGDDDPPEEVNIIEQGADYGWPDCVANQRFVRWGNQARQRCGETRAPVVEMQAHAAPLGLSFYTGDQYPAAFRNDALVAFHGSWNRTQPSGYKVTRVRLTPDGALEGQEDFLWGFLNLDNRTRSGRPVQAIPGPDGAVYVSDDGNGQIYRVAYVGPRINEGGIVRAVDDIFSIYGLRFGEQAQVFANGLAADVLYAGEGQINFRMPSSLRGEVTVQVRTAAATDEAVISLPSE